MSDPPKYKRKKKVSSCPNPLFVQWLTEWRDEAAEKGIKTQYAYSKALSALKKYPLPFHSGKAAKILDNFGDKICGMLDKKLQAHLATQVDSAVAIDHALLGDAVLQQDVHIVGNPALHHSNVDHSTPHLKSPSSTSIETVNGDSCSSRTKSQKGGTKRAREYIPLYRSGPYSLILTLYKQHKRMGSKGFMTKTELQTEAQPLCDKSMTMPDPGSHYTAWSSMSTLITKGYICKEGSPARYVITETGCELAHRLESIHPNQLSPGSLPGVSAASASSSLSSSSDDNDLAIRNPSRLPQSPRSTQYRRPAEIYGDQPNYWYIDDSGQQVRSKDDAVLSIDDDATVGFLIKCSKDTLRNSTLRYRLHPNHSAPIGFSFAFLHNDDALDMCPASRSKTKTAVNRKEASLTGYQLPGQTAPTVSHRSLPPTASQASRDGFQSSSLSSSSSSSSSYVPSQGRHNWSKTDPATSGTDMGKGTASKERAPPLFTLRPGQFDVILCVDNCETAGIGSREGKGRKQVLLKELQKNGVPLDVRKLQVGDFLWVARERGGAATLPGVLQVAPRREVVLDYVVERKRMDDLCSSIQDGRFKEQKFRLKQCGLGHYIYLVEEFGSADHMSLPAATLQQSTVNTQVIDGFFVKYTRDTKESAAYLTIMTRYLHSLFSAKTLLAYRREDLDGTDITTDVTSCEQHCLTFQEFNDSSVKNKETTVTETFAKQLLQFSGMTAEKALALTQLYSTPSHLLAAYDSCLLPADREKMLARTKYGHSQRNMGPMLSKLVYQHYWTSTALT